MPSELIFFHKGLSYDTRSALQEPGFLQTAENISFKEEGSQKLRPPFSAINSTAVNAIHSIKQFGNNILIGDSTNLRSTVSGDFTSLGSTFSGNIFCFREYKNFLIAINGGDSVLFDTGGNLYNTEVANPTAQCAGTAGAAGDPDGVYAFYYTFYITWPNGAKYETGFSPVSDDVTLSSESADLTGIAVCSYAALSGKEPTIHRKIYVGPGTDGSLADIYYVTTIEDNTTTTYNYDMTDAAVGANDASVVDDYEPGPSSKYQEFHYGQWFLLDISNPHRLYYSEVVVGETATENEALMPLAFKENNWDDIRSAGYGHVDPQGLISWGTYLYIPLKQTWIRKQGDDQDTWSYKKTWAEIGIAAPYTIEKCGNPAGILGVSSPMGKVPGISLFNGQTCQIITSPKFDYIFEEDLNHDAIDRCRAKWDGKYYHLLYPSGSNTKPDKWAAFDFTRFPDIRLAYWMDLNGRSLDVDDQNSTVYVGGSDGYVRSNTGSESIDINIRTHELIGGNAQLTHTLKHLKELKYALDTNDTDVTLEIYIDGVKAKWPDGEDTKSISGSDDITQLLRSLPPSFRGYRYSLRIYGSDLDSFEIYSPWEMIFDVGGN